MSKYERIIERLKEHLANPEYNGEYPNKRTNVRLFSNINIIRKEFQKYINKETGEFNEKMLNRDNDINLIKGYQILKENSFHFITIDFNHTINRYKRTLNKLNEYLNTQENKEYPTTLTNRVLYQNIKQIRSDYKKYINKKTRLIDEELLIKDNILILIEGYKILKRNNFKFINEETGSYKNIIKELSTHLEKYGEYPTKKTNFNLWLYINKIRNEYKKYKKSDGYINEELLYKENDFVLTKNYELLKNCNFIFEIKNNNIMSINDDSLTIANVINILNKHLEKNKEYPSYLNKDERTLYDYINRIRNKYKKYIQIDGKINEKLLYEENNIDVINNYKILKNNNFQFVNTVTNRLLSSYKNVIEKINDYLKEKNVEFPQYSDEIKNSLYSSIIKIRKDYKKYIDKETGEFNEKLLYEDNDFILIEGYKLLKENNFKFTNEDSKKIIFDNSYKKYVENLNTDISRAELKQNHQKKFKEENEELFFNNYLGEDGKLNYKKIKKSTNIINYKFKKLLEIGFFEDKYLNSEIKDLTKEEKQYRIRENLVFKITNGVLNNKELLEGFDLNQDVENIKEEIQLFIEEELENENKEYKDIYEMKGNNEQVVYKDCRKLLQYSYLKYKELYGEENSKKFHIINDNHLNPNSKGYDYTITPNKELVNQFNISKEDKSHINVSYKYILGKSFGTIKTEEILLVKYDDIESKTIKSKAKAKEIDEYV